MNTILDFKSDFDRPMRELLPIIYTTLMFKIVYRLIIVRFTMYIMQTLTEIALPFDM